MIPKQEPGRRIYYCPSCRTEGEHRTHESCEVAGAALVPVEKRE